MPKQQVLEISFYKNVIKTKTVDIFHLILSVVFY